MRSYLSHWMIKSESWIDPGNTKTSFLPTLPLTCRVHIWNAVVNGFLHIGQTQKKTSGRQRELLCVVMATSGGSHIHGYVWCLMYTVYITGQTQRKIRERQLDLLCAVMATSGGSHIRCTGALVCLTFLTTRTTNTCVNSGSSLSRYISVHHVLFTRKLLYDLAFTLTSMDHHEIMSD